MLTNMLNIPNFIILDLKESEYDYRFLVETTTPPPFHCHKCGTVPIMMPEMDGFQVLEKIRKTSSIPILMLTAKSDSISKVIGLRSGADDYLIKPFDMNEFMARVHSLIRRYTNFNPHYDEPEEILIFDGLTIDLESRSVSTKNSTLELPPKEFDILVYCA